MRLLLSMRTPTRESYIDVKPFKVRLRFHGDLNVFLGSKTGDAVIERQLAEKTSIKDIIESCGIPHPEVDLILIDEEPVRGTELAADHGSKLLSRHRLRHAAPAGARRPLFPVGIVVCGPSKGKAGCLLPPCVAQ